MIKELKGLQTKEDYTEALQSLQTTLEEKENQIKHLQAEMSETRTCARREQRLVMSAWYELGMQLQQQAAKENNPPQSWLAAQRQSK